MKITRNRKNKNLEISPEMAAIEGNPKIPAMIAIIKKMNAHFNIFAPMNAADFESLWDTIQ